MIIPATVQALVTWTHSPDPKTFSRILTALTPNDLQFGLMHLRSEPAGRVCWAEYGRRFKFFDFQIKVSEMDGTFTVKFEAASEPIHHGVSYVVKS